MSEKIKNLLNNTIEMKSRILFKEVDILDLKLYFAFEETITIIYKNVSAFDIKPLGFILKDNGEWIFAPIAEDFGNSERIVKTFVEEFLKN